MCIERAFSHRAEAVAVLGVASQKVGRSFLFRVEQKTRSSLYNKSKHGVMFASSASALDARAGDVGPVAMYAKKSTAGLELPFLGLQDDLKQPGVMAGQTLGLADALGDVIAFYLWKEHADVEVELKRIVNTKTSMMMLP